MQAFSTRSKQDLAKQIKQDIALWSRGRVDEIRSNGPGFDSNVRRNFLPNPRWI